MKVSGKKVQWAIYIIITLLCFFLWRTLRPVKIIAVHNRSSGFSDVLVDHFPLTVSGKIAWWQENKEMLKSRYGIPAPAFTENFSITFWLFGDGYMEPDEDERLCFTDMKTKKKCIEKNKTFTVDYSKNTGLFFTTYAGYHRINDKGEIVKMNFN
ncbi:DUF943 family protein [Pantoea alhagi]|uniref:DUF943 family protein n=1 Tax=Pantoea alhagi TaxID=1891675 RepID=UPI00202B15EB|nr:DUF943 family protein [Pantoea alhagi]URQ62187.1 DUF943 family protein [Pantoea alhagi]